MKKAIGYFFCVTLLFALSGSVPVSAGNTQDKVSKCNQTADKKNLQGDERKTFLQNCLGKAQDVQQDKRAACNKLADEKNLQGHDRASFLKDCINKANSR